MQAPFTVTISPQTNEHLAVLVEAMNRLMPTDQGVTPKAETKPKKAKAPAVEIPEPSSTSDQDGRTQADPVKVFDLMSVRARLAELSKSGKAAEVKTLITEMGATKLTDIPASRYAELMEKAGAL